MTLFLSIKNAGHEFSITRQLLSLRQKIHETICTNCNSVNQSKASKSEHEIEKYFNDFYTKEIIKNDRKVLNGKELDIYIPEKKLAIEFDRCLLA